MGKLESTVEMASLDVAMASLYGDDEVRVSRVWEERGGELVKCAWIRHV